MCLVAAESMVAVLRSEAVVPLRLLGSNSGVQVLDADDQRGVPSTAGRTALRVLPASDVRLCEMLVFRDSGSLRDSMLMRCVRSKSRKWPLLGVSGDSGEPSQPAMLYTGDNRLTLLDLDTTSTLFGARDF